jgi:hypothetical protein
MTAATEEHTEEGCIAFLRTDISKDDLATTLRVIAAFKACESREEWLSIPFAAWGKLEQLEDYLKLLTGTDAESVDDERAIEFLKALHP